jgi:hypothetical protein
LGVERTLSSESVNSLLSGRALSNKQVSPQSLCVVATYV